MNGNEKGLSLIEVLVSLVILVIGLIGVFNLHIISKQGSFEAFQQTQAAFLANDLLNRMQANPSRLDEFVNRTHPEFLLWLNTLQGDNEEDQSSGNATSIGGLDDVVACVQRDAANANKYIVAISWRSIREMSDGATNHYTTLANSMTDNIACGQVSARRRLYMLDNIIPAS